jgi:tol-pal system protein YbgF
MKRFAKKTCVYISGLLLLAFWGCASQGDVSSIDNRLSELEIRNAESRRNKEELQSDLKFQSQEAQAVREQTAALRAKIDALEEEMRILSGRIEELEHSISRQQMQRDEYSEKREGIQLDKMPEAARVPIAEVPQELPEDELYRVAKQSYDDGDSDTARRQFQELIERFPKSQMAGNAQFWIGESFYRDKWYEKAILEYQKVIENYPGGNKVGGALLKQGFAFINLGDTANARLIFEELIRKFPDSNEAKIAKQKLAELK